ncbi:MAG: TIGR02996 domain-containing protein [Planctomycetales bacterium]|nr:TIGR02996 domain-containing protein [Planctomycetales bacterium]
MDLDSEFLKAILADPDDDMPRLVYADWLHDQGDPRGEFIQLQCELAEIHRNFYAVDQELIDRHDDLVERQQDMLLEHGDRWRAALAPLVQDCQFQRGLLQLVRLSGAQLRDYGDRIMAAAPICLMFVTAARGCLREALRHQRLSQLTGLAIDGSSLLDEDVSAIVELLQRGRINRLVLTWCSLTDTSFAAFGNLTNASLRDLDLANNSLRNASAMLLATTPGFGALQNLVLTSNMIRLRGAQALARSEVLTQLDSLSMGGNPIDQRAVSELRSRFQQVMMQ